MSRIRITKQFSFETGHALYGYDGKCRNVHGHSYKLSVTVIGEPIEDTKNVKFGMVIDFGDLKKIVKSEIVDKFDHATVFNKNTPHAELAEELKTRGHDVILVEYQPTSENMVTDFAKKIRKHLPQHIQLHSLKLQETDSSFAEWYASDNAYRAHSPETSGPGILCLNPNFILKEITFSVTIRGGRKSQSIH